MTARGRAGDAWPRPLRDSLAHVPDETARLTEELATVRAELAALRRDQEQWEERVQRIRSQRDRAQRSATRLADALAHHLRVDAAGVGKGAVVRRKRQQPITRTEAAHLELIRASDFFDPSFYLRIYPDVAERGDDPALHFLRRWYDPMRLPSDRFDTAQYAADHPEVWEAKTNPLVHFLLSPQSHGVESYPPEPR